MKELRESLKAMQLDFMKELQESLKAMQLHDPMKELRESLKAMQLHDPMKELRESLKAMQLHDPMKELRESLKAMQLHDPMDKIRESLNAYQTPKALSDLSKQISYDRWAVLVDGNSNLEINTKDIISVDSRVFTQKQIQEIARKVINKTIDEQSHTFEQYVTRLINEIHSLKDPIIQRLLVWLIYPIIVGLVLSIVNPIADFYIKEKLQNHEKKLLIKSVSKTITNTLSEKRYLTSFRIVSSTSLNVRRSGSNKSDIIGVIYLGDIVEVIEKGRKWSLISWKDTESDVLLRGWVFSRYLKVIK